MLHVCICFQIQTLLAKAYSYGTQTHITLNKKDLYSTIWRSFAYNGKSESWTEVYNLLSKVDQAPSYRQKTGKGVRYIFCTPDDGISTRSDG